MRLRWLAALACVAAFLAAAYLLLGRGAPELPRPRGAPLHLVPTTNDDGLAGPVAKTVEVTTLTETGSRSSASSDSREAAYDATGRLMKETGGDGTSTYSYDAKGRLSSEATVDAKGQRLTIGYRYDSGSGLLTKTVKPFEGCPLRIRYIYDPRTRTVVEREYERGRYSGKTVSTLDRRGNATAETNFDDRGRLQNRLVTRYDGEGRVTQHWLYAANGRLRSQSAAKYDRCGRLTKKGLRDFAGGSNWTCKYGYRAFDKFGNWTLRLTHVRLEEPGGDLTEFTSSTRRHITYRKTAAKH